MGVGWVTENRIKDKEGASVIILIISSVRDGAQRAARGLMRRNVSRETQKKKRLNFVKAASLLLKILILVR